MFGPLQNLFSSFQSTRLDPPLFLHETSSDHHLWLRVNKSSIAYLQLSGMHVVVLSYFYTVWIEESMFVKQFWIGLKICLKICSIQLCLPWPTIRIDVTSWLKVVSLQYLCQFCIAGVSSLATMPGVWGSIPGKEFWRSLPVLPLTTWNSVRLPAAGLTRK